MAPESTIHMSLQYYRGTRANLVWRQVARFAHPAANYEELRNALGTELSHTPAIPFVNIAHMRSLVSIRSAFRISFSTRVKAASMLRSSLGLVVSAQRNDRQYRHLFQVKKAPISRSRNTTLGAPWAKPTANESVRSKAIYSPAPESQLCRCRLTRDVCVGQSFLRPREATRSPARPGAPRSWLRPDGSVYG